MLLPLPPFSYPRSHSTSRPPSFALPRPRSHHPAPHRSHSPALICIRGHSCWWWCRYCLPDLARTRPLSFVFAAVVPAVCCWHSLFVQYRVSTHIIIKKTHLH